MRSSTFSQRARQVSQENQMNNDLSPRGKRIRQNYLINRKSLFKKKEPSYQVVQPILKTPEKRTHTVDRSSQQGFNQKTTTNQSLYQDFRNLIDEIPKKQLIEKEVSLEQLRLKQRKYQRQRQYESQQDKNEIFIQKQNNPNNENMSHHQIVQPNIHENKKDLRIHQIIPAPVIPPKRFQLYSRKSSILQQIQQKRKENEWNQTFMDQFDSKIRIQRYNHLQNHQTETACIPNKTNDGMEDHQRTNSMMRQSHFGHNPTLNLLPSQHQRTESLPNPVVQSYLQHQTSLIEKLPMVHQNLKKKQLLQKLHFLNQKIINTLIQMKFRTEDFSSIKKLMKCYQKMKAQQQEDNIYGSIFQKIQNKKIMNHENLYQMTPFQRLKISGKQPINHQTPKQDSYTSSRQPSLQCEIKQFKSYDYRQAPSIPLRKTKNKIQKKPETENSYQSPINKKMEQIKATYNKNAKLNIVSQRIEEEQAQQQEIQKRPQETSQNKYQSTNDKSSKKKEQLLQPEIIPTKFIEPNVSAFTISTIDKPFIKKYNITIENYEYQEKKWPLEKVYPGIKPIYSGQLKFERYISQKITIKAIIDHLLSKQNDLDKVFKNSRQLADISFKISYSKRFNLPLQAVLVLPLKLYLPQGYNYFYSKYSGRRIRNLVIYNQYAQICFLDDIHIQERNEEQRDLRDKIKFDEQGIWINCQMLRKKLKFTLWTEKEEVKRNQYRIQFQPKVNFKLKYKWSKIRVTASESEGEVIGTNFDAAIPSRIYGFVLWQKEKNENEDFGKQLFKLTCLLVLLTLVILW